MASGQRKQIEDIEKAIDRKDISKLRELSRRGFGFVNTSLRKRVWPLLLGCDEEEDTDKTGQEDMKFEHDYTAQISKDTARSMYSFDVVKELSLSERQQQQAALERILNGIYKANPSMHYTQGFHDMCSVFYIVCGEELGAKLSENLAKRHMRDLVRDNIEIYQFVLKLLFPLLAICDSELHSIFADAELSSIFALSWILTWV